MVVFLWDNADNVVLLLGATAAPCRGCLPVETSPSCTTWKARRAHFSTKALLTALTRLSSTMMSHCPLQKKETLSFNFLGNPPTTWRTFVRVLLDNDVDGAAFGHVATLLARSRVPAGILQAI